jgi:hypothetical protein
MISKSSRLDLSLARARCRNNPDIPLVVLDLASVETYLLVGMLSRRLSELGGALWCPLESGPAELDLDRAKAIQRAAGLHLSVTWPDEHWSPVPRAMRVAVLAMAHGCAEPYIRTMSRMAFAAGLNVDRVSAPMVPKRGYLFAPEPYYVAVDEALELNGQDVTLATQRGSGSDLQLRSIARTLSGLGITRAPGLRFRGEIHIGAGTISSVLAEQAICDRS